MSLIFYALIFLCMMGLSIGAILMTFDWGIMLVSISFLILGGIELGIKPAIIGVLILSQLSLHICVKKFLFKKR